ncbi:TlpA disulfide reductase family protein [uncultured Mucilaginibacter sp.]|uniref:TlpA family protein disulfide reductase n=1 Tax=uncultured Mucilaginibacter sp. TaxID=797541 RepID=UPI0026361D8E|nr:TlpA disulfide reductase family protein [uncultured Mucilaginibacter sp.]
MKNLLTTLLYSITIVSVSFAQTATLKVNLKNTSLNKFSVWIPKLSIGRDYLKKSFFEVPLDKDNTASYTFPITEPKFVNIYCRSSNLNTSSTLNYQLYLSPGDSITLKADFKKPNYGITVTGKGSNNNQPLLALIQEDDIQKFDGDTTPNRVIAFIKNREFVNKKNIKEYVKLYKPDVSFLNAYQLNSSYYFINSYFSFKENNKFQIGESYKRNFKKWQYVQDSIFKISKIDNSSALTTSNYTSFIRDFLLREKERLWQESAEHQEDFYKKWYNTDVKTGAVLYNQDNQNLLKEKIINNTFTGKTAEYLHACVIDEALYEANPNNIVLIFENFKSKYPESAYISWYEPAVNAIKINQEHQKLTETMVFANNNGLNFNSLNDVLALVKGKTVLLDMWGTWCGPCRQEMEKNDKYLKEHFKDKGLDYLYIANYDQKNEEKWKELIAYFHLDGTHILANEKLNKDIMDKVKGTGYPTYVVIKKDGSYELSKAGYPMNRAVLIQQLEKAIAQ